MTNKKISGRTRDFIGGIKPSGYASFLNRNFYRRPDLVINLHVREFSKKDYSCIFVQSKDELNDFHSAHSTNSDDRTRAYFKIQDGCDYKCTFCTIPLARGGSRSLETKDALYQFEELVDQGYKEIILTGVNVGDYGKNLETNLYSLLNDFVKILEENH